MYIALGIPISWFKQKPIVCTIPIGTTDQKYFFRTITTGGSRQKPIALTIPINREDPKQIAWNISIVGRITKSFARPTSFNRHPEYLL